MHMPRRFLSAAVALLGLALLSVSGIAGGPSPWTASAEAAPPARAGCTIRGFFVRTTDEKPQSGVTVLALSLGTSTQSDASGFFSLDVGTARSVTLRAVAPTDVVFWDDVDAALVWQGSTDLTFAMSSICSPVLVDSRAVSRIEGPVSRPTPPAVPSGFMPAKATLEAKDPPLTGPGNGGNVPWIGYFWLTAPVVTAGVCDVLDAPTRSAADAAIQAWQNALGLGWQIVRNDDACKPDFPQPKLLITRDTERVSRFVLASTPAVDMDGKECTTDLSGSVCWVGTATIKINPGAFDHLPSGAQVHTILHEMGHALGLAHTRGCGDSVMWWDLTECPASPLTNPGSDDIASLNELLAATLPVLRAAAPQPAQGAPTTPPADAQPQDPQAGNPPLADQS
jgi:hypothetical protein